MQFSYVADHFQYIACVGPIVLLVAAANRLGQTSRNPSLLAAVICLITVSLGIASNLRCQVFLNRRTLWEDTLAKNSTSPMAHNNYAVELMHEGDLPAAQVQFHEAMQLRSDAADWIGMGQCLAISGDYAGARDLYQKAIDATPESSEPVIQHFQAKNEFQLGTAYEGLAGQFPARATEYYSKAEAAYRRAYELYPEYEIPRTNLAALMVSQHRFAEAIDQCRAVLAEDPDSFSAHMNLGRAYYAQGQLNESLAEYQSALDQDPQNSNAMASIGGILAQTGQLDRAISMLQDALKIDPSNQLALQNLAAAVAKKSR
jgi:tetratricopeptide (TPR) repeat protein